MDLRIYLKKNFQYIISVILIFIPTLISTTSLMAGNKEVTAVSSINKVTVFSGHANVERVSGNTLEPGVYTLVFPHLPVNIIDDSIRVSGKGTAAAKILNVKTEKVYLTEAFQKDIQELENDDIRLRDQSAVLDDQLNALGQKETMLKMLSDKTFEALSKQEKIAPPSLQQWQGMLDFIETTLNGIYQKRREIEIKKNALNESRSLVGKKLSMHRANREKAEKKILVDLEILQPGRLNTTVSYIIGGVQWLPQYDLRLVTTQKKAGLTCSAMVSQQTGEDWKNVELTFSTARPMVVKRIPVLSPIFMDPVIRYSGEIQGIVQMPDDDMGIPGAVVSLKGEITGERSTVTDMNGLFRFDNLAPGNYSLEYRLEGFRTVYQNNVRVSDNMITKPRARMMTGGIRQEIVVSENEKAPPQEWKNSSTAMAFNIDGVNFSSGRRGSGKSSARILTPGVVPMEDEPEEIDAQPAAVQFTRQNISLSFSLKHKESVMTNKEAQKAAIFIENVGVELEHAAVPRLSEQTFLKAVVKNTADTPFLGGGVNIFLDGIFVNTGSFGFINPGDSFDIPVGVDESVLVTREPLREKVQTKGVFKKSEKKHLGYLIQAKNFGKAAVTLRVNDQIPVSRDKKIRVVPTSIQPEPEKRKNPETEEDGIMEWVLTLAPGETKTIRVEYDLFHPEGMQIMEEI
jgi:hypothetical protein